MDLRCVASTSGGDRAGSNTQLARQGRETSRSRRRGTDTHMRKRSKERTGVSLLIQRPRGGARSG